MIRVLLINQASIPHFRVPIYGYLSNYLLSWDFDLIVAAEGIQAGNPHPIDFNYIEIRLSSFNIFKLVQGNRADILISWVDLKHMFLFPMYFIAKGLLGRKMIYWGQGCDLLDPNSRTKNLAYAVEQFLCDAIILYAAHLKQYVVPRFHQKIFIANNTLCIDYPGLLPEDKKSVLQDFGIHTKKNIICIGRLQGRKRLEQLFKAFALMNRPEIGLIIVGPDSEGILDKVESDNIFKLGPIYGNKKFDLLSVADVYCLPGAVGLSIIDAFYCGLPFVTEDGDESAEIEYLKDGINGFAVPRGDVNELANKLSLLLDDDQLRLQYSTAARQEYEQNAHIDRLCEGFRDALNFVTGRNDK